MGLIGDILYPDNPKLAKEANEDQEKLQKTNNFHNKMVTVYRELSERIRTFDSYLMSVLVMQYFLIYEKEDLSDLPDTNLPVITQSLADKIETIGLDSLSVKMACDGVKAIYNRIANVTREAGSYREYFSEGGDAIAEDLAPGIDSVAAQADIVSSANVDVLTSTELTTDELTTYAGEMESATESLDTIVDSEELTETSELPGMLDTVSSGIEATAEATEASEAAVEAAADAGVEVTSTSATVGAPAILGPAIIVVIVITEIISLIEDGQTHEKLLKALKQLKTFQAQADASIVTIKKAFKSLLKICQLDVKAYNEVLKKLYQLEKNQTFCISFSTDGMIRFIDAIDGLTVDNYCGMDGFQTAFLDDLAKPLDFIRKHALNDCSMMEVISMIRTHVKKNGVGSVTDNFLQSIATTLDMDIDKIKNYNRFRLVLNDIASALVPYHQQIQTETPPDAKKTATPSNPKFGTCSPDFQPHPLQFQIPRIISTKMKPEPA